MSAYQIFSDFMTIVGIVLFVLTARAIWTGKIGANQRSEKGKPPKEWR